jgi:hypothetical protein
LRTAFEKGYRAFIHLANDNDLDNIRNTPEYVKLLNEWENKTHEILNSSTTQQNEPTLPTANVALQKIVGKWYYSNYIACHLTIAEDSSFFYESCALSGISPGRIYYVDGEITKIDGYNYSGLSYGIYYFDDIDMFDDMSLMSIRDTVKFVYDYKKNTLQISTVTMGPTYRKPVDASNINGGGEYSRNSDVFALKHIFKNNLKHMNIAKKLLTDDFENFVYSFALSWDEKSNKTTTVWSAQYVGFNGIKIKNDKIYIVTKDYGTTMDYYTNDKSQTTVPYEFRKLGKDVLEDYNFYFGDSIKINTHIIKD